MRKSEWLRRIERAQELASRDFSAGEILRFYAAIASFQAEFYNQLHDPSESMEGAANPFAQAPSRTVLQSFASFLAVVEAHGPNRLRETAEEQRKKNDDSHFEFLAAFWRNDKIGTAASSSADFLARAYLQPFAAMVRERADMHWSGPTPFLCPFCQRKPGVGVLRPLGDGGQRSLVCSFCLAEWEFRRIVCPGCGEEDHAKLPVYTADELKNVRVEACDSCRIYIKTVDMTKSGLAEPTVDEIASIPLDVWAQQHGYTKLQVNLLQM